MSPIWCWRRRFRGARKSRSARRSGASRRRLAATGAGGNGDPGGCRRRIRPGLRALRNRLHGEVRWRASCRAPAPSGLDGGFWPSPLASRCSQEFSAGVLARIASDARRHKRGTEAERRPHRFGIGWQPHPQRAGGRRGRALADATDRRRPADSQPGDAALGSIPASIPTTSSLCTCRSPRQNSPQPEQQINFYERVLERVRASARRPVSRASSTLCRSTGDGSHQPVQIEGRPLLPMADQPEVDVPAHQPGMIERDAHPAAARARASTTPTCAGQPGRGSDQPVHGASSSGRMKIRSANSLTMYFFPVTPSEWSSGLSVT